MCPDIVNNVVIANWSSYQLWEYHRLFRFCPLAPILEEYWVINEAAEILLYLQR